LPMYSTSHELFAQQNEQIPTPSLKFNLPPAFLNSVTAESAENASFPADHGVVIQPFAADPSMDVYQIGRASGWGNDFTVLGTLHVDDEGSYAGPVSRWACRIECERLAPWRCFLYAGGLDPVSQVRYAVYCIPGIPYTVYWLLL
jgi:hypothetical protein